MGPTGLAADIDTIAVRDTYYPVLYSSLGTTLMYANRGIVSTGGESTVFMQNGHTYKAHRFLSTGAHTFTITAKGNTSLYTTLALDILLIGGGGSGGSGHGSGLGGGGGAGCVLLIEQLKLKVTNNTNWSFALQVGAGGSDQTTHNTKGNQGSSSSITIPSAVSPFSASLEIVAPGGGGGGSSAQNADNGAVATVQRVNNALLQPTSSGGGGGSSTSSPGTGVQIQAAKG
jgi:hypothetical protein